MSSSPSTAARSAAFSVIADLLRSGRWVTRTGKEGNYAKRESVHHSGCGVDSDPVSLGVGLEVLGQVNDGNPAHHKAVDVDARGAARAGAARKG